MKLVESVDVIERETPPQGGERKDPPGPLALWRSMEVPAHLLGKTLGKDIQERLATLSPTLIVWELTEEHTAFFLDHQRHHVGIHLFLERGDQDERELSSEVRWYLQELRRDLREIIESGATRTGMGSYFAIENRPSAFPPVRPQDWNPETIAFVEQLRPKLVVIIKARHIDHWLQTPQERFGKLSPIQVIEYGGGDRIRALIEEMRVQG